MTNIRAGRARGWRNRYFKSLNMHICDIIVAVTVLLGELEHRSRHRQRHHYKSKFDWLNKGKIIVRRATHASRTSDQVRAVLLKTTT